jgi:hypothetical protein
LIRFLATYNDKVAEVVLDNVPQTAKYTSPKIQKEILHILATKVRDVFCKEIGVVKFCILVDEALDESKMEQMTIILRFVDKDDFIRERLFGIVDKRQILWWCLLNAHTLPYIHVSPLILLLFTYIKVKIND